MVFIKSITYTFAYRYIHPSKGGWVCKCVPIGLWCSIWKVLDANSSDLMSRVQYWPFIRDVVDLIMRTTAWGKRLFLCLVDFVLVESLLWVQCFKQVMAIISDGFLDLNSKKLRRENCLLNGWCAEVGIFSVRWSTCTRLLWMKWGWTNCSVELLHWG